jgi:hypothetical protein
MEHRGKTSAHAPNYENMAGNLNINFQKQKHAYSLVKN